MQKQVCIVGLGSIGLPTACVLATSGFRVLGVDTNMSVLKRIQSNDFSHPEPFLQELLKTSIQEGYLKVSTQAAQADIYLIAVPTLLNPDNQPDLSHLYAVIRGIQLHLRPQNLVLIESTCPIGTTEAIAKQLQDFCPGVHVAYCPERVIPGNILYELIHNDRVVGGVDEASTLQAKTFYESFVTGQVFCTHARTAEAVKLVENTYRDINIAYANELSIIADRLRLDVNELISLANRHPRVNILKPGPGVGGACIAINPWFLISSAPDLALLSTKAREINENKTDWVIAKVRNAIREKGARVVACLGLSYKPDVADTRHSPAMDLVHILEKEIEILRVDPHIEGTVPLNDAILRAEIVVGLVAHRSFLTIPPQSLAGKIVLDFAGIFT